MTQPLSHNLNGDDFAVVDEVMRGKQTGFVLQAAGGFATGARRHSIRRHGLPGNQRQGAGIMTASPAFRRPLALSLRARTASG